MYTSYLSLTRPVYRVILLFLVISLLESCSQSHQLGMEANPQEILEMKLNNRDAVLTPTQSVSLLGHCAELGRQNAVVATDKEIISILGNSDEGKSTTANYWMGCQMHAEIDEFEIERIVVDPESDIEEIMAIGHGSTSKTFMPQAAQDPNNETRVYVDCPGFHDNRGAEINIANAANIRRILQQARGVKVVLLTNHVLFRGRRAVSIKMMEEMCEQMFGNVDNLRRHQASILWGINRAHAQVKIGVVREWLLREMNSSVMQILAQRIFLYDPLDRGGEDFWSRDRFLAEIDQMPAIPQEVASTMFQTALTNDDREALQKIVKSQVDIMKNALEQDDYTAVERGWNLLNQLQIIGHKRIDELIDGQVRPHMQAHAEARVSAFSRHAAAYQFAEAEQILTMLRSLHEHFPDENLVDFESLEASIQTARAQLAAKQEAEEKAEEAEEKAEKAEKKAEKAEKKAEEEKEARVKAEETATRVKEAAQEDRIAHAKLVQKIDNLERALAEERSRNQIWGAVINTAGQVAVTAIKRGKED